MKKQYVLVGLLLLFLLGGVVASGCQGADPNENAATVCALSPSFVAMQIATGTGTCATYATAGVINTPGGGSSGGGSSGSTASSSGSSGSGGDGGALAPIVGCPLATFDTNAGGGLEGIILNTYHDTSTMNLGDPNLMLAMPPVLGWDGTVGNPSPGSLSLPAPYSGANQYVDIQNTSMFGTAHPQDWSGGTLHVRIRAEGTFVGGVQPYVDTTSAYAFGGFHTNYSSGTPVGNNWRDFTVKVSSPMSPPAAYDPTKVIVFGVQISSDQAGASQRAVTFHIDSFSVEGVSPCPTPAGPAADGGASGGDGSDGGASGSDGASAADAPGAE